MGIFQKSLITGCAILGLGVVSGPAFAGGHADKGKICVNSETGVESVQANCSGVWILKGGPVEALPLRGNSERLEEFSSRQTPHMQASSPEVIGERTVVRTYTDGETRTWFEADEGFTAQSEYADAAPAPQQPAQDMMPQATTQYAQTQTAAVPSAPVQQPIPAGELKLGKTFFAGAMNGGVGRYVANYYSGGGGVVVISSSRAYASVRARSPIPIVIPTKRRPMGGGGGGGCGC